MTKVPFVDWCQMQCTPYITNEEYATMFVNKYISWLLKKKITSGCETRKLVFKNKNQALIRKKIMYMMYSMSVYGA